MIIKIFVKDVSNVLDAVKNRPANLKARTRLLAALLLAFFLFIFLAAQITIIANANHECIGDGCPICKLIDNAEMLLKQIGKTIIAILVFHSALFFTAAVMMITDLLCRHSSTLVQIKIRLNN